MCEFRFLAITGICSLVLVYVPAIIIVTQMPAYSESPVAYLVADYLPHLALMFVYTWRVWNNLSDMHSGRSGTWSVHAELETKATRSSRRESSAMSQLQLSTSGSAYSQQQQEVQGNYIEMYDVR